jgi:hypothetical protein
MNVLTELWIGMPLLSYTGTRGWPPDAMQHAVGRLESRGWVRDGGLTDEGRARRLSIEQRTDEQEQAIIDALGDRLDEICGRLNHWGQRCIEAGAFPPDILKRAAGSGSRFSATGWSVDPREWYAVRSGHGDADLDMLYAGCAALLGRPGGRPAGPGFAVMHSGRLAVTQPQHGAGESCGCDGRSRCDEPARGP